MTTRSETEGDTKCGAALAVLEHIKDEGSVTMGELLEATGLEEGVIETSLDLLVEQGYVAKESDQYVLGLKFVSFGEAVRQRSVFKLAKEKVDHLADITSFQSYFITKGKNRGMYLFINPGELEVQTKSAVGNWLPLHASAGGKSILSQLPEDEVRRIIDEEGLPAETSQTITDETELLAELEDVRNTGFALNREEQTKGFQAVGAPICRNDGRVIGALSVGGPVHRMDQEWFMDELPEIVVGNANELELTIEYS